MYESALAILSSSLLALFLVVPCAIRNTSDTKPDDRAPRRGRRSAPERGLPERSVLLDLARSYLIAQRKHWPDLATSGTLPSPTPAVLESMADDFEQRFLNPANVGDTVELNGIEGLMLAASYLRYSDSGSNSRSLAQQLLLQLERARSNGHFIPWQFVFADAAVTGTTSHRHGYQACKGQLGSRDCKIVVLYIDQIGRASRDAIEALRLGRFIEANQQRLIGVSDGFDSTSPMSRMQLSLFGMLHEWFIDQLRSKVKRGMADAFWQRTSRGRPCLGVKLIAAFDSQGRAILGRDGEQRKFRIVDEQWSPYVLQAYQRYEFEKWTLGRLAIDFNQREVGGKTTWDAGLIRQLLSREIYAGIDIYNRTYQIRDPETGKTKTVTRPRNEWLVQRDKSLQIVPYRLWKAVQKRLALSKETFGKWKKSDTSRSEYNPTLLVRLWCKCCDKPLWLGKGGPDASYACRHGHKRKHNCSLTGYKRVRIVNKVIIDYLKNKLLSDERIVELVEKANKFLLDESSKPIQDVAPLRRKLKELRRRQAVLQKILRSEAEEGLRLVVQEIRDIEHDAARLQAEVSQHESRCRIPKPISLENVRELIQELQVLLKKDVAVAAPIIEKLTGKIWASMAERPDRKPVWVAEFSANLVPVMLELAAKKKSPTTRAWAYLNTHGWTFPILAEAELQTVPRHVRMAPIFQHMRENGCSINAIAIAHNCTWQYVKAVLRFADEGMPPDCLISRYQRIQKRNMRRRNASPRPSPKYIEHAPLIAKLRNDDKMSFSAIVRYLNDELGIAMSAETAVRAFDYAHPEMARRAVNEGSNLNRGRNSGLGEQKLRRIRELVATNPKYTIRQIADEVGCGTSSVHRELRKMRNETATLTPSVTG